MKVGEPADKGVRGNSAVSVAAAALQANAKLFNAHRHTLLLCGIFLQVLNQADTFFYFIRYILSRRYGRYPL